MRKKKIKDKIIKLSEEIRSWLIAEAKKRGDTLIYNKDGSIDCMETDNINGMHILKQGWVIAPPYKINNNTNKVEKNKK